MATDLAACKWCCRPFFQGCLSMAYATARAMQPCGGLLPTQIEAWCVCSLVCWPVSSGAADTGTLSLRLGHYMPLHHYLSTEWNPTLWLGILDLRGFVWCTHKCCV